MANNKDRIQGIFPKTSFGSPKPYDISEDEWIDNMIGTWCLNSSQAGVDGVLRHAIHKAIRENKDEITIDLRTAEFMQIFIDRDTNVLLWLWDFWRKEKGLKSFEELREESRHNNAQ